MNHQDKPSWPHWVGFMTAANLFIAMLAARELSALRAWRIAFWPSVAISALTAIAIGVLVTIACRKMERARLARHAKRREHRTRPEEREYITKAASNLSDLMQRPLEPSDRRRGKKKERPFVAEIKTERAEERNAETDDDK